MPLSSQLWIKQNCNKLSCWGSNQIKPNFFILWKAFYTKKYNTKCFTIQWKKQSHMPFDPTTFNNPTIHSRQHTVSPKPPHTHTTRYIKLIYMRLSTDEPVKKASSEEPPAPGAESRPQPQDRRRAQRNLNYQIKKSKLWGNVKIMRYVYIIENVQFKLKRSVLNKRMG